MNNKLIKIFLVIIIIITVNTMLFGCSHKEPEAAIAGFNYLDTYPEWLENAPLHNLNDYGAIDNDVTKAIYLFRQASYNEIDCTQYAYFLNGGGNSIFSGANLTMRAQTIHIQNGSDSFHQMINLITDAGSLGLLEDIIKTFVSRSYQRTYYGDNKYYRKGTNSMFDANDILIAAWGEFETTPLNIPNEEEVVIDDEYLNNKYTAKTFLKFGLYTDTIAEYNSDSLVLSEGTSVEALLDDDGNTYYKVIMAIDINVANNNADTIEALKNDTDADPVEYTEFTIEFEVWENGLFKSLNPKEGWSGTIKQGITLSGGSIASNPRLYSYHPDDCDLTDFIALLP